ncbi:MAG TPA: hypothetical protein VK183_13360 [Flavobacterium sp.]|nr:hypothetical protein [Flavobacterium sp.]
MKRFSILALMMIGCFAASCNEENDNSIADFVGTYDLTEYNAPMAMDYDQDGDSSANLATESTCFTYSTITLYPNGTYSMRYNGVKIVNGTSTCSAVLNTMGTWTYNANIVTATPNGVGAPMKWEWTFGTRTLTSTSTDVEYPSYNSTTGVYSYATGTTSTVYTKQ